LIIATVNPVPYHAHGETIYRSQAFTAKSFPKGEYWVVYEGKTEYFLWADERIERGKVHLPDPIIARILDYNNNK
jgi:hypothetical protein